MSDKPSKSGEKESPLADLYQDSQIQIDPALKAKMRGAAPEVSQGAWRERAYAARPTLSADEICGGLKSALKNALVSSPAPTADPEEVRRDVKTTWLPLVRQAVEQAGGDGVDALVWGLIGKKKSAEAKQPLFGEMIRGYHEMNHAETVDAFMSEAGKLESAIAKALAEPKLHRLSFKALEKDLEGRLDLDEMLNLLFSTDQELEARLVEVKGSLDTLREQLKSSMGTQPNALLWNFSRLKVERAIIEGEQRRRAKTA